MEVKLGYKQTDVGVIPKEWEIVRLSELVIAGPKNGYSGRCGKESRGTPTLSLSATTPGCLVLNDDTVKRLDETIDARSDLYLKPGDVLVQRSNTADLVGTTAVFDGPAGVYVYPDLMMRMRFREDATAHWFWRYANSASGRRFFISIAAGSSGSMPKISGEKLRRMTLPSPPLPEQRAIASVLSDVDSLLGALDRLVAKKRDLKQAAMQQLLSGQTRLSGEWEMKRGYKQTEVGVIPNDWETETILGLSRQIIDYRGRTPRKLGMDWGGGDILALSAGNVKMGFIDFSAECYYGSEVLYKRWMTQGEVAKDDIVFTTEAPLGNVALIPDDRKYILSQRTVLLQIDPEQASSRFLFQLMLSEQFQRVLADYSSGSTAKGIQRKKFEQLRLAQPPLPEQTAIANVLSDMDAELSALEQRHDKTRALKQAMMQELLTGKTRLVSPRGSHA